MRGPGPRRHRPHAHHEYEIFIAISGDAELEVDGERRPFKAGDIATSTPAQAHRVINDGDADFELYAMWWDTDMSDKFVARHTEQA